MLVKKISLKIGEQRNMLEAIRNNVRVLGQLLGQTIAVEKGDEWVKESVVERSPFLDDDDNPIELKEEEAEKPKRRRRKSKTDPENV